MRRRNESEEREEHLKLPSAVRVSASGAPEAVLSLGSARNLRLGRSRVCELYFSDEHVSREHGLLWRSDADGAWRYRDLGSSNGTKLSRCGTLKTIRVGVPVQLQPGDVLLIGDKGSRIELLAKSPAPPKPQASPATTHFKEELALAARHSLPLVFFGPSGSGKTWAARRVHELSGRKGAFVPINCGRLPKSATELRSELLGHVAGAFTDAKSSREGKLFHAHEGTLFLDEVESLPAEAQDFLLDVLEGSATLEPLGAPPSVRPEKPAFRLISASKLPLAEAGLRFDLCQRLMEGDVLSVPGLEDRAEDIPELVRAFLAEAAQGVVVTVRPESMALLVRARWPGHVRELQATVRTVVQRALARAVTNERLSHLVLHENEVAEYLDRRRKVMGGRDSPTLTGIRVAEITKEIARAAVEKHGGNKTHAAKELGIALNTLKARLGKREDR